MSSYFKMMRKLVGTGCLFLPGVRAIIPNEVGEILLQRRTDMPLWGLPAGSLELDETALEALKREVREETALEVLQAKPIALYSGARQKFTYPNGDQVQCFAISFIVRQWEGSPQADGAEGSEVRFFPLSQLPKNIMNIHAQTIEDYKRYDGKFILA